MVDYTTLHILGTIIVQWRDPEKNKRTRISWIERGILNPAHMRSEFNTYLSTPDEEHQDSKSGVRKWCFIKLIDIWWWHASSRNLHCSLTILHEFGHFFHSFRGIPLRPICFCLNQTDVFKVTLTWSWHPFGLSLMWNMFRVEDMSWWLATSPWNNGA